MPAETAASSIADTSATSPGEWTISRLLAWTKSHFEACQVDEPRLAAELLLAECLGCKRIELYTRFAQVPSDEQRAAFREMVRGASEHKPIAYLVGHKEFYSLDFLVTPDVLIPRPETELIVEKALAWCQAHPAAGERFNLLDIGTGSGCIAVTIAKRLPAIHAVATDASAAALEVARRNAERHGVAERIRLVQADLLNLPPDLVPTGGFDLVLSNPPYVAEQDRDTLPENVRQYEPHQALFSGADGLAAFRRISQDIRPCLRPGGAVIVEVGYNQADAVQALFTSAPANLDLSGRFKDLAGIDRALQFTLPA